MADSLADGAPLPASQSSALTFPGGPEWAPYYNKKGSGSPALPEEGAGGGAADAAGGGAGSSHVWNPYGSGSSLGYLPIPVFSLTGQIASDARRRAKENAQHVRVPHARCAWLLRPLNSECLAYATCACVFGVA